MSTLPLNVKQKRAAFGAVAVLILMFLCPPWYEQSQTQMYHEDSSFGLRGSSDRTHGIGLPLFHDSFNGYHWLFAAPSGRFDYDQETSGYSSHTYKGTSSGYHIAWGILFLQWIFISLVTLAFVHRYRDKPQVVSESKTSVVADDSPEIITSKPEPTLPVEKDIVPSKNDNDETCNTRTIIIVSFSIGLLIIGVVLLGSLSSNKTSKVNYTPNEPGSLKKEPGSLKVDVDRYLAGTGTYELSQRGIVFMEKGDYQQAIIDFNKLIEIEPLDHAAYNNRGEAYLKLGNYRQAKEDFNRAIIAYEKKEGGLGYSTFNVQYGLKGNVVLERWAKYYRNRGLSYEKLGNKAQSIDDMKKAAKIGDKEAQKYLLSKEMDW